MSACRVSTALKRRSKFATIAPRSKSSFFQCVLTAVQSWTLLPPELVHTCSRRLLLKKWRLAPKQTFGGKRDLAPPHHTRRARIQFKAWPRKLGPCVAGFWGERGGFRGERERFSSLLPKADLRGRWPPLFMSA